MWMLCSTPELDLFSRALRKKKAKSSVWTFAMLFGSLTLFLCVCVDDGAAAEPKHVAPATWVRGGDFPGA
jgi:hypothetical protein